MKSHNLIVFREKHCSRHFMFKDNDDELDKIYFKVFVERVNGNWYGNVFKKWLLEMIKHRDYFKIRQFLHERGDFEYEGFYTDKLEEMGGGING